MKYLIITILLLLSGCSTIEIPEDELVSIIEKQKQHEIYLGEIETDTKTPLVIKEVKPAPIPVKPVPIKPTLITADKLSYIKDIKEKKVIKYSEVKEIKSFLRKRIKECNGFELKNLENQTQEQILNRIFKLLETNQCSEWEIYYKQ